MIKTIIAIDPGKKGAIVIFKDGEIIPFIMPLLGKDLDEKSINSIIYEHKSDDCCAFIEKVHAMPKQGVTSMFNFGMGYGMLRMALVANRISYQLVTPQAWKKKVLSGLAKDKSATINYVARKYPNINLMPGKKRTPHDGIADAICIGEYGSSIINHYGEINEKTKKINI